MVRTSVQLSGSNTDNYRLTFTTAVPAEQANGITMCTNLDPSISGAKITVVWDDPKLAPVGKGMCKRLALYSAWGCTGKPGPTIARPARTGPTCHKDCGAAECVVKDGQQQCHCPEGLVFNAAKKLCRAAPPRRCLAACCVLAHMYESAGRFSCS
ncbi:unnamed protein product [Closterium sp. Naga37s-1]|nr:unnamed protein product [Closterium sp. Naga37s-1]